VLGDVLGFSVGADDEDGTSTVLGFSVDADDEVRT